MGTAASYFRSPCSDMKLNLSYSILPAQPGALVNLAAPGMLAPAGAPAPLLQPTDVVDPPLPPVKAVITADAPAPKGLTTPLRRSAPTRRTASCGLASLPSC